MHMLFNQTLLGSLTARLSRGEHFLLSNCNQHDKMQLFAKFKKILRSGFRATLNFRKFSKIRDVCMDFDPYLKVHNLVSVHPKSIILGQMTNRNMIVHVVVSVYRLVKI